VITSLLALEAGTTEDTDVAKILQESRNRVRAMGLVHERFYRSADLANVDFQGYIKTVVQELQSAYAMDARHVAVRLELEPVLLGVDQAVPCGLLINELVTNALKHAFPEGRAGTLAVSLHQPGEGMVELAVADDGIGMADDFDWQHADSLGLRLVTSLTRQLQGEVELERKNGVRVTIRFKRKV
jgi:two-component sensor histidine kinase